MPTILSQTLSSHALRTALVGLAACACLPAQTTPWTLRVGPAAVLPDAGGKPEVPKGSGIPGSDLEVENGWTLGCELGYSVTPNWTARLVIGTPVEAKVTGKGSIAAMGTLGKVTYGPAALTGTYCVGTFGAFRPYLGAGVAYLVIFDTKDGALADLKAKNNFGTVFQVGTDINIGKRFGLFVDARKIFVNSEVTGTVPAYGGAPAYCNASIDPLVIHGGVSYRF